MRGSLTWQKVVPDSHRRPGDPISARSEFALLKSKGLLTDMTVIVYGTGLEARDFIEMRAAQSRNHIAMAT
jgi:hypothetical protein